MISTVRITKPVPEQKDAVKQLTLAFLDAYVLRDAAAKLWLSSITNQIGECPVLFRSK